MQRELISLRILIEEYIIEDCWYNAPAERSLHVTYRFESCILQMKEESYQGYSTNRTWFRAKIYTLTHITWLRVYHFPLPDNSTAETVCFLCVQSRHLAPTVHQSIYRIFSSISISNMRVSLERKLLSVPNHHGFEILLLSVFPFQGILV